MKTDIRGEMEIEKDITEEIERPLQKNQVAWFGHVNRMKEEIWPKRI